MKSRLIRKLSANNVEMESTPIPSLESSSEEQTTDTEDNDQHVLRNGRLHILTLAYASYTLHPVPPLQGNPEFEMKAKTLFDDILKHENIWFRQIFDLEKEPNGLLFCERAISIIDAYASIQHYKGKFENAYKLLIISDHIVSCYADICKSLCTTTNSTAHQLYYFGVIVYRHNLVLLNVHTQIGNRERAVKVFRDVVKYEINDKNGAETKNLALILPILYGPDYINLTLSVLEDKVTDEQIWFALKESIYDPLARCKNCYKKESFKSEFRTCSKCKKVFYCSRECQKTHWKDHKYQCIQNTNRRNLTLPENRSITQMLREGIESKENISNATGRNASRDDEDYTTRQNIALERIMELMQKINVHDKSDF